MSVPPIVEWYSKGARMIDELKEEGIVNKVGGRFKLSTLIQKRMVALNTGARPLVDLKTTDKMSIVVQEILQDKIYLDQSGNLVMRGTSGGDAVRRAMLTDISDVSSASDD
jgi:DNA-directed RNA polymerase subunit omega